MHLLRLTLPFLALLPFYASADVCDIAAKWGAGNAAQCRASAAAQGASITDNWMTYKPVNGRNPKTGNKALFTSTSTVMAQTIGFKPSKLAFMYLECFEQKRQMRIDETGMISLTTIIDRAYTFKVDGQPPLTETWKLDLEDKSHHAPVTSVLPEKLKGAKQLQATWQSYGKTYGYIFDLNGYDRVSATLCK